MWLTSEICGAARRCSIGMSPSICKTLAVALCAANLLTTGAAAEGPPERQDVASCERSTRKFLASDYVSDNEVPSKFFTKSFAKLWRWACNPPPGQTIWWGADPVLETQDEEPELVSLGSGAVEGDSIRVPVVYRHAGNPPFTKTFVFNRENGRWLISDILTSGIGDAVRSEAAEMTSDYGKPWW